MKKGLLKGLSIAALSLGLLISPMTITPQLSIADTRTELDSKYKTHGWFYTLEEMKEIYKKEYEGGKRLENHVEFKDGKYIAYYDGKSFTLPEKFVKHTLSHLEQMTEKGYAKYLFKLDAYHGHLFIPEESFYGKYESLYNTKLIEEYTKDEQLGALYHNAEHLALKDETGKIDSKAKDLISKRSVLGWYGGRPLELTHPKEDAPQKIKEANSASVPDGYCNIGNLTFMATKNGEFTIKPNGKEIKLDISFDDFSDY